VRFTSYLSPAPAVLCARLSTCFMISIGRKLIKSFILRRLQTTSITTLTSLMSREFFSLPAIWLEDKFLYVGSSETFYHRQGRNHVFIVGGPVPWSRVLLPFYRKKLDRSTQFDAVGYIVTLFIKKLRENLRGPSKFWIQTNVSIQFTCRLLFCSDCPSEVFAISLYSPHYCWVPTIVITSRFSVYRRGLLLLSVKVTRLNLIFIFSYKTIYVTECSILQVLLEVHTTDSEKRLY